MTDKKKRGRPPGSGKKKPEIRYVEPVSPEVGVAMYNAANPDQHTEVYEMTPDEVDKKFGHAIKEHFNDVANGRNEKPLPSNWNEMGKVQKLEWLTANPRK